MKILIIDAKENLKFRAQEGIEIDVMRQLEEKDLETIAKLSPDLIFLSLRFPGYRIPKNSVCLQGPQILPLLCKHVPGVPVVGVGEWPGIDESIDESNLSGIETRDRFNELFKEFYD